MNESDLLFGQSPGGCDLVFGGTDTDTRPPVDVTAWFKLPGLSGWATAIPDDPATVSISLPGLQAATVADYQSRAARPVAGQTRAPWEKTETARIQNGQRYQYASGLPLDARDKWGSAEPWPLSLRLIRPGKLIHLKQFAAAGFEAAWPVAQDACVTHAEGMRRKADWRVWHDNAIITARIRLAQRYQECFRDRRGWQSTRYAQAQRFPEKPLQEDVRTGAAFKRAWHFLYENAWVPLPGRRDVVPILPRTPCYSPSGQLRFVLPVSGTGALWFVCGDADIPEAPRESRIVSIRKVYVVVNQVTLHRVSDGMEIPTLSLSLSLEAGSWTWGFDAVLPGDALGLLGLGESGPQLLEASINGTPFRLLPENISRERAFNESAIRLSGRGHNAVLAAPYAPVMNFGNSASRSARQLMDDVLTLNGVTLGWSIDWQLTDWIVPAGIFSHQGTWIEAVSAIAAAAGGYVLPHPSSMLMTVKHRYGTAPWNWNTVTPDIVLPMEAVSRESLRFAEKPSYNRVFVSGQETGVLGQVTRTGTAGDLLAPMVVDPLITDMQAARQRGLAILSDTGMQVEVSLKLPLLEESGIVTPGMFVEYRDGDSTYIGMVRSTRIEAGIPEVWQTLAVESHG